MRIKLYPLQPFPRTNKMHTRAVIFCCWFSLVHCVFFSLVACAVLLLLFGLHFSKQEFLARTSFFLRSLVLLLLWLPPLFNAFTELFVLLFFLLHFVFLQYSYVPISALPYNYCCACFHCHFFAILSSLYALE